jgi:predicted outer membrane protein
MIYKNLVAVIAALLIAPAAFAQTDLTKDRKAMAKAMAANTATVELLRMVGVKGQDEDFRNVAAALMSRHLHIDRELKALSERRGFSEDPAQMEKALEKIEKWRDKPGGQEWDSDVAEELADMYKDGIDMFDNERNKVEDPEVKNMLTSMHHNGREYLPTVDRLKEQTKKTWKKTDERPWKEEDSKEGLTDSEEKTLKANKKAWKSIESDNNGDAAKSEKKHRKADKKIRKMEEKTAEGK